MLRMALDFEDRGRIMKRPKGYGRLLERLGWSEQ